MKNTLTQRIVLGLIALFVLGFVGLQVYRYFTSQYKTETAYLYTVEQTSRVTGIALRAEQVLEDTIGSGVATYLVDDGAKVSKGSRIAEIYQSETDIEALQRLRDLANQKDLLEQAQDPGTTSYAHTDVLNRQIFEEIGMIIDSVNSHSLSELDEMSDSLLVLMNTKQVATGKQDNFNEAIEQIDAEMAYYQSLVEEDPTAITSPRPGYFIRKVDGYENQVDLSDLNNLDNLTPEMVFDLVNSPAQTLDTNPVGKLMTSHNWYYAAIVVGEEREKYRVGSTVTLDFHISGISPVPAVVWSVNTQRDSEEAVVVFRCNYINKALINLRVCQADVQFESVTGLRVSDSAIRFSGIQKGVYIVLGERLVFRPVTVIYEDVGFVLCQEYDAEYEQGGNYTGLQQYDEVVIEGARLYDDKPI